MNEAERDVEETGDDVHDRNESHQLIDLCIREKLFENDFIGLYTRNKITEF